MRSSADNNQDDILGPLGKTMMKKKSSHNIKDIRERFIKMKKSSNNMAGAKACLSQENVMNEPQSMNTCSLDDFELIRHSMDHKPKMPVPTI